MHAATQAVLSQLCDSRRTSAAPRGERVRRSVRTLSRSRSPGHSTKAPLYSALRAHPFTRRQPSAGLARPMPMSAPPHASTPRGKEDDAMIPDHPSRSTVRVGARSIRRRRQSPHSPRTRTSTISTRHGNTALDPVRPLDDRQDKAAAPAAVRSVSTPRYLKELRRTGAVHTGNSTIQRKGPALGRTAWLNPPVTGTAEPMR